MKAKEIAVLLALVLGGIQALEGAPGFAAKPTARPDREGVRIDFVLSAPTDVVLDVIDRTGRVVRHLGAGVLGDNAPPPFVAGSLRQSIFWDRKKAEQAIQKSERRCLISNSLHTSVVVEPHIEVASAQDQASGA